MEVVRRHADHRARLHVRLQPAQGQLQRLDLLQPRAVPGRRDQRDDAEHEHRRHPPGPVLQSRLLRRRRAVLRAADAAACLGQDLADRHGWQPRRDHRRGQGGVELPAEAGLRHGHLRHQPALAGGGRAVEGVAVPERRLLRLGAEPQLLRSRQASRVQGHLRPVHHRRRHHGYAAFGDQLDRGPAAAERRGPDRRAAAGGLRGRVGAHPGRRRDRAEPVQPGQRPAATPAVHAAGPGVPDQPAADRVRRVPRLRRPGQRAGAHHVRPAVGLAAGKGGRTVFVLADQGGGAAQGARLDGRAERHRHLPAAGHRPVPVRGRRRRGRQADLPAALRVRIGLLRPDERGHPDQRGAGRHQHHPEVRAVQHPGRHHRHLQRAGAPELHLQLAAAAVRLRAVLGGPDRVGHLQHRREQQLRRLPEPGDGPAHQRDRVRVGPVGVLQLRGFRRAAAAVAVAAEPDHRLRLQEEPGRLHARQPVRLHAESRGLVLRQARLMTWYLIRRLGQSVAVVIGVMILTFLLLHLEPGSVARSVLGLKSTPARVAIFDSLYGLNKPLYQQFGIYVKQLFQGNLGISYQLQEPVASLIGQRLPRDAILLGLSTLLALVIGVPTGIYQALKHNQLADDLLAGSWFTLYSAPDFMEALLLIALLCVQFHVLPPAFPGGVTSVGGLFANWPALVLPVTVLAINSVAGFSQYVRSTALQALAEDYIRVARAKGLPERLVLTPHVLRNSLLPVITILGLSLPDIVAGAVIAESIFNFPGMGLLFWQSALAHDFPVMLGGRLVIGVALVLGNLAADVAYSMLDPRTRYGRP